MADSYSKINWQDADSTATPINAENLNHMDNQIKNLTDAVNQNLLKYVEVPRNDNVGGEVDSCTDDGTIYRVYLRTSVVSHDYALVICFKGTSQIIQYALTTSKFILFRRASFSGNTIGTWGDWDFIPTRAWVENKIQTALGGSGI